MRVEGATLTEIRRPEARVAAAVTDIGDSERVAEPGWQDWVFPLVALALLGYGCYLAWGAWDKLRQVILKPGSPDFVVIALAIQVVAPFLPPLAYLSIWLSGRREESRFLNATVLSVVALVTAVIEVCAHTLG
jgi:hypothetical protein